MRIEVENIIDNETKEIYGFNAFDFTIVFTTWHREEKPKGKRKWVITSFWDKYSRRDFNMSEEPELPEAIRQKALTQTCTLIKVKTWNEYKS